MIETVLICVYLAFAVFVGVTIMVVVISEIRDRKVLRENCPCSACISWRADIRNLRRSR